MDRQTHDRRRWSAVFIVSCFAASVAAGCGDGSSRTVVLDTPNTLQAPNTPPATATALPTSTPTPAMDPGRLPVQLHIPGEPDEDGVAHGSSLDDFTGYIHVVDLAEGTARRVGSAPLTYEPDDYFRPRLSPNGMLVAYLSRRSVIMVDLATGSEQAFPLPPAPRAETPCLDIGMTWGADSTRLAVNTEDALLILDTGSGIYREIIAHSRRRAGRGCDIAWSSDGAWILYSNGDSLVRIRPDGSDRFDGPPYYASPDFSYSDPHGFIWSPDSTRIFFSADTFHANEGWATISFVSGLDLIARGIPIGQTIVWLTEPMYHDTRDLPFIQALSMSGTRAAYIRSDHDENWKWTWYLETRDVNGTNGRTLVTRPETGGSVAYVPYWSPNDTLLAYPYRPGGGAGPWGSVRIVDPVSVEDLAAVLGPNSFQIGNGGWVRCDVLLAGWLSATSLATLTTCEVGE